VKERKGRTKVASWIHLIEEQNHRFLRDGTSDGKSLLLTSGQTERVGLEPQRLFVQVVEEVRIFERLLDLLVGDGGASPANIVLDAHVEYHWLL
jgi:hypothetical protein